MTDSSAHAPQSSAPSPSPAGNGIFDGFAGYMTPTPEDWKRVLNQGTVVVDTNVLLNLYRYNQEARTSLLETLEKLGDRLWVPHQVMSEFWRARDSAINDPERQLQQSIEALREKIEGAKGDLRQWVNRVSLDRESAGKLEGLIDGALSSVIGEMESVVDTRGIEVERDTSKDGVLASLEPLLAGRVGRPFAEQEKERAVAEGKRRVAAQIPPGYKDRKKESRGDDSEVGDYLVWAQLIQESVSRQTDVLLVTGDGKEDWWRIQSGETLGPRVELVEELLQKSGSRLYMVKPERLLRLAREILEVAVTQDTVQNVEMVDAEGGPASDEGYVGTWNYAALASLMTLLRAEASVQADVIEYALENGGYVSRNQVYEIGGYDPGRMLKGFTRPVTRLSLQVAAAYDLARFEPYLLKPDYDEMKAGFGWVDGFRVPASVHEPLRKALRLLDDGDSPDVTG
ncbi:PIN-like domain-containing protein [Streptomyces goshikiensis]|uniref:PIN-like domain-containing protein n=1 Tax=Streptomyces goshikiensis TaxID=1942 RepID=UPI0036840EEC